MSINLYNKSFLSLKDFTKEEIQYLIDFSIILKNNKKNNIYNYKLKNKNIAMVFEKTSTRTRCATSVACFDEGAHAEYLGKNEIQLGKKESVADTARVLGRMFDAIVFRGYKQSVVEKLSKYSKIPVINGLTDIEHPTQILADFMTIKEYFKKLEGIKIAFLGDGNNNVSNSLLMGASKMGLKISIASPKNLQPDKSFINALIASDKKFSGNLSITIDPYEAVKNADVIYTDVWISMGEEKKKGVKKKLKSLKIYSVDDKVMEATGNKDTIFLHCLPASHEDEHHNLEVTEEVFESSNSLVFDQAENRMHTIKAILISLIGDKNENS